LSWHVIMSRKATGGREICLRDKFSPYRRGEVPLIYSGAIHKKREWMPSNEKLYVSHFNILYTETALLTLHIEKTVRSTSTKTVVCLTQPPCSSTIHFLKELAVEIERYCCTRAQRATHVSGVRQLENHSACTAGLFSAR
jgi:hypothetical protein